MEEKASREEDISEKVETMPLTFILTYFTIITIINVFRHDGFELQSEKMLRSLMLRMRKPRARQENEAGTLQPYNIPYHVML
jgi:hypothetical protein